MATKKASAYRRDCAPPTVTVRPLIKLDGSFRQDMIVLSEHICGYETHYFEHRTRVHPQDGSVCPACVAGRKPRWSAFLEAWFPNYSQGPKIGVIEITKLALDRLFHVLRKGNTMRGTYCRVYRQNGSGRKPLIFEAMRDLSEAEVKKLPAPIGVQPTLSRLWGIELD